MNRYNKETEPDGHTPRGFSEMSIDEIIAITTYIGQVQKINEDGSLGEPVPLINEQTPKQ